MHDPSSYFENFARDEATNRALYLRLARREKNEKLRALFLRLADYDSKHYEFWLSMLNVREVNFSRFQVTFYAFLRWLFGAMFAVKLLERGEHQTMQRYKAVLEKATIAEDKKRTIEGIINDELSHEKALFEFIEDSRVKYMGSAVLGLNDALVELTGVLAGLTSTISTTVLIAFSGLVVGIAASLSMAASFYLSIEVSENKSINPTKAAAITGTSYLLTTLLLVVPFFTLSERFTALAFSLGFASLIILALSNYSSVVLDRPFGRSLLKMLILGLGVAAATYLIGRALSVLLGIAA